MVYLDLEIEIERNGKTIKKTKSLTYKKDGTKKFYLLSDEDIHKGDLIIILVTNQKYRVIDSNPIFVGNEIHHYETHHYETIVEEIEEDSE